MLWILDQLIRGFIHFFPITLLLIGFTIYAVFRDFVWNRKTKQRISSLRLVLCTALLFSHVLTIAFIGVVFQNQYDFNWIADIVLLSLFISCFVVILILKGKRFFVTSIAIWCICSGIYVWFIAKMMITNMWL